MVDLECKAIATANKAKTMTRMIDTNGKEHEIKAAGNVATLQTIGWTVKSDINVPASKAPTTECEWDAIFGRR